MILKKLSISASSGGKLIFQMSSAYLAAFAVCNIGGFSPSGILSILLFGVLLFLFAFGEKQAGSGILPKGFTPVNAGLAALFTLFYMAAEHKNLTGGFDSRMFRFLYVLLTAAGLFFLFRVCCRILMLLFCRLNPGSTRKLTARQKLLFFSGLLLCWLPWFLYDFPGVLTPDSLNQFSQAAGLIPYSSHHSIVHTLLFEFWYRTGFFLTHSINAGIAFYTVFQMLTLAAVETCCLSLLAECGIKKWLLILFFLFWGIMPYNGIYAVTVWKDVLFSAFLLLYALVLFRLLKEDNLTPSQKRRLFLLLFISGWLTCMLRSNGLYIFIFTLPFVLFVFRRQFKVIAALQLFILLLSLIIKGPVLDYFQVSKPHFTESLSIPLQQVARVVTEGRQLTEKQTALINHVVDISFIPDYYHPSISDPVKALVIYNNADYLIEHKADFFRLWLDIGLQYPRDYMEAFIDQTKGYWYPAPAELRTNEGISPNEIGLAWPHLLRGQLPVKISEILLKMPDIFPVYGILWSIGAFFWAALFLAAYQFLYGDRKYLLIYVPFVGTILTLLLATPVASDMRYAYPLFLGMPLLFSLPILRRKGRE